MRMRVMRDDATMFAAMAKRRSDKRSRECAKQPSAATCGEQAQQQRTRACAALYGAVKTMSGASPCKRVARAC